MSIDYVKNRLCSGKEVRTKNNIVLYFVCLIAQQALPMSNMRLMLLKLKIFELSNFF